MRHPAKSEIDPSAARQQRGRARKNLLHAVEHQPRSTAHNKNIAGAQFELLRWIAAPQAAVTEAAIIAKRNRDHRRGQIRLVAVLVQVHPRGKIVEIDQAGLRRMRIEGEGAP